MVHAILMPKPGQMTEECTLILWRKAEGDVVHKGDVLFEIETDKSAMEVESFDEGILLRQVVAEGATVPVSTICAWVGQAGEAVPDVGPASPGGVGGPAEEVTPSTDVPPAEAARSAASTRPDGAVDGSRGTTAAKPGNGPARFRISPRASRLAASAGLDPRGIAGSGPDGRIIERDVEAAIAGSTVNPGAAVSSVVESTPRPAAATRPAQPLSTVAPPHAGADDEVVEPMSRMRRVIAERLTESWTTIPHFTITVAADLHRLLALRADLKEKGTNLSVTDFVLTAVAQTLVEFQDLNTRVEGTDLIRRKRVHLGLAVSVPGGLLVPVVRDAHLLSVLGIHERAQALIAGARAGSLSADELSGSTFTVSNLGMFEVHEFSAIINPGEGAILAVASAVPTPVAIGEGIAVHPIMKMTLSADHRVVDGQTGARFLAALRRRLEDAGAFRNQMLEA